MGTIFPTCTVPIPVNRLNIFKLTAAFTLLIVSFETFVMIELKIFVPISIPHFLKYRCLQNHKDKQTS